MHLKDQLNFSNEPNPSNELSDIFGYLGAAFALFFFISPLKLFLTYIKTNETKQFPILIFFANSLNCFLWVIVGSRNKELPQWLCNVLGLMFSVIWSSWYSIIILKDKLLKIFAVSFCFGLLLINTLMIVYLLNVDRNWKPVLIDVVGFSAAGINIIMYAAPGQNLLKVIQTGDNCLIPILSSVIGLLCSASWLLFSLFNNEAKAKNIDLPVFIPNVIGVLVSIIQIVVWTIYNKKNSDKDGKDEDINNDDNASKKSLYV